jgi:hypothetical protein
MSMYSGKTRLIPGKGGAERISPLQKGVLINKKISEHEEVTKNGKSNSCRI